MHRILFLLIIISLCSAVQGQNKNRRRCKIRDCSTKVQQKQRPVCGGNNVTYENHCLFYNAECEAQRNGTLLTLAYKGRCGSPRVKGKHNRVKGCRDPSQHCKPVRNLRHAICGTNNVTYPTMCHFRAAKCEAKLKREILGMKYRGRCGEPKIRNACAFTPWQCPSNRTPVCASNGITYRNLCAFLYEKCSTRGKKKKLSIQYKGKCGSPVTRKPCPSSCPDKKRPVCATNGKTYKNGCELAKFKCSLNKNQKRQLKVKHNGECGNPQNPRRCLNVNKCRRMKGGEVCGSDGKTYRSKCHLRVKKCNMKKRRYNPNRVSITIKHMGKCRSVV